VGFGSRIAGVEEYRCGLHHRNEPHRLPVPGGPGVST
jgi:hypothetical protein